MRLANENAGRDNITCVIVDVLDDAGRDPSNIGASRITSRSAKTDPELTDFGSMAGSVSSTGADGDGDGEATRSAQPAMVGLRATFSSTMTWRVGLFFGSLVLLGLFVFGFIWWTGNRTYFVGTQGDQVVIYRGKPGGLLWIEPELVENTDLKLDAVPDPYRSAVNAGVEQPTLSAARTYVRNVENVIDEQTSPSTTTSSSGVTTTTG